MEDRTLNDIAIARHEHKTAGEHKCEVAVGFSWTMSRQVRANRSDAQKYPVEVQEKKIEKRRSRGLCALLIAGLTPRSPANLEPSGKFVRVQRLVMRFYN